MISLTWTFLSYWVASTQLLYESLWCLANLWTLHGEIHPLSTNHLPFRYGSNDFSERIVIPMITWRKSGSIFYFFFTFKSLGDLPRVREKVRASESSCSMIIWTESEFEMTHDSSPYLGGYNASYGGTTPLWWMQPWTEQGASRKEEWRKVRNDLNAILLWMQWWSRRDSSTILF